MNIHRQAPRWHAPNVYERVVGTGHPRGGGRGVGGGVGVVVVAPGLVGDAAGVEFDRFEKGVFF